MKLVSFIANDILDKLREHELLTTEIENFVKEEYLSVSNSVSKKYSKRVPCEHNLNVRETMKVLKDIYPDIHHRRRMVVGQYAASFIKKESMDITKAIQKAVQKYNEEKSEGVFDLQKVKVNNDVSSSLSLDNMNMLPITPSDNEKNEDNSRYTCDMKDPVNIDEEAKPLCVHKTQDIVNNDKNNPQEVYENEDTVNIEENKPRNNFDTKDDNNENDPDSDDSDSDDSDNSDSDDSDSDDSDSGDSNIFGDGSIGLDFD